MAAQYGGREAEISMLKAYRTDVQLSSKKVFTVFKKGVIFWSVVFAPATHVSGVRRWRLEAASA
jgi:hypothetical protein